MPEKMTRKYIAEEAKRIVVKIGSAVLTRREMMLDHNRFSDIGGEIAGIVDSGRQVVIVSSGAIACGMEKLGLKKVPADIPSAQAAAAAGQVSLMQQYEQAFIYRGKKVAQMLFTAEDLADPTRSTNARNAINRLLELGLIPIINENDSVATEEIKFGDNDALSAQVTGLVDADLLIILSTIEGLYTADPGSDAEAKLIPVVAPDDHAEIYASGLKSPIGRGGMESKITAARNASHAGVPTVIASGKLENVLTKIFQGEEIGTLFLPAAGKE